MALILASGSPRRLDLLVEWGYDPVVQPTNIDETPLPGEAAADYVLRLAIAKNEPVARGQHDMVISADTIVTIDGELLGKPANDAEAVAMLQKLSGRTHEVMTGVSAQMAMMKDSFVETTVVRFDTLTDDEIEWYVSTGEPADKAGAYAIQGIGGAYVTGIEGSYDNVIGLPRYRLRTSLSHYGRRQHRDEAMHY